MRSQRLFYSFIPALLLLILLGCTQQEFSVNNKISQENIELAVDSLDALANRLIKKTGVPGIAIAVVHGDELIYARGFGIRKVGTDLKVDPDTVFQLASVSKSLASTVVAGVVGQGHVRWEDPINNYLPTFTLSDPLIGLQVKIEDMFAHRSGLPHRAGDDLEDLGCSRTEIIHQLRFEPLNPYGVNYNYSNFGLTTGAEAAAAAAGQSWEDLSHDLLYAPLRMNSTSSRWSDYDKRINKADIHTINSKGDWIVSARQPDAQSPAGGVSSSVNDLAKWMILELNQGEFQGKQIIQRNALLKTWEKMMRLPTPPNSYYGLGIILRNDEVSRLHLTHAGAFTVGAETMFDMLPSEHLGIVVLTNGQPLGISQTLIQEFYDIVIYGRLQGDKFKEFSDLAASAAAGKGELGGKATPTHPSPAPLPSAFVGTYVNDYFRKATIESNGNVFRLTISPCGKENSYVLSHWDGNTFSFLPKENGTDVSSLLFTPADGIKPATIKVEFLDENGLATFRKLP